MCKFRVVQSSNEIDEEGFYLVPDDWDDWFEYEVSFYLYIKEKNVTDVGRVKIVEKNQSVRKTMLPSEFELLENNFVSIGFNEEYYEYLKQTEYREKILKSLNDIAYNLKLYDEVKDFNVTKIALMREYSQAQLKGQVHRMALGGAKLTDYNFTYIFPSINPLTNEKVEMLFEVERTKKPSSNIHVMVGKNGIGKTTIIKKMIYALEQCKTLEEVGEIKKDWRSDFSNIVFISFSAFDEPIFEEDFQEQSKIPYKFVGLVKKDSIKSRNTLTEEFIESSFEFYKNTSKMKLWKDTITILESDNTFVEQDIGKWIDDKLFKTWNKEIKITLKNEENFNKGKMKDNLMERHRERVYPLFSKLSSGHKIILLTLANLIELVEEKTVVFLDEPEEHLHPPLVAAFIQALSNLLIYRNGVGIIATHSPVIVQEVPKKCVWILNRAGEYVISRRPEIETFGENLGELTTEIFGYEVINSGFHKELQNAVKRSDSYEEAKAIFCNQLGKEAKSILRAYMYDKEENIEK